MEPGKHNNNLTGAVATHKKCNAWKRLSKTMRLHSTNIVRWNWWTARVHTHKKVEWTRKIYRFFVVWDTKDRHNTEEILRKRERERPRETERNCRGKLVYSPTDISSLWLFNSASSIHIQHIFLYAIFVRRVIFFFFVGLVVIRVSTEMKCKSRWIHFHYDLFSLHSSTPSPVVSFAAFDNNSYRYCKWPQPNEINIESIPMGSSVHDTDGEKTTSRTRYQIIWGIFHTNGMSLDCVPYARYAKYMQSDMQIQWNQFGFDFGFNGKWGFSNWIHFLGSATGLNGIIRFGNCRRDEHFDSVLYDSMLDCFVFCCCDVVWELW